MMHGPINIKNGNWDSIYSGVYKIEGTQVLDTEWENG